MRADLVLLVLSDAAVRSKWIQLELGAALGMGKQVIPIAIGDVVEADLMDYLLRDSYWIDARNLTPEEVVSRLDLGDAA